MDNFKTWLERQAVVDSLGSLNPKLKDFGNLFGDKSRIVIPLEDDEERNLAATLEKLGFEINFQTGMATSEIETKQGKKQRSEKVGSILAKLNKKEPNAGYDDLLHWWEKSRGNAQPSSTTGVSIIISRNPIDIVRMSDHREWKSCHSPDGSYFKCAVQEAKTGGAIAYIVANSELQHVPDLQAQDIFTDRERGIKGIQPLERIRLRKFSDGHTDLLVPEMRTYGTKHTGFLDTILRWARNAQGLDKNNPPDFDEFDLYGGSYQDNNADDLWNQLFDTEDFSGSKDSQNEDDEDDNSADEMEEQAQAQVANHSYEHVRVYYDIDGADGEPYLYYSAQINFNFPKANFIKMPTDEHMQIWGSKEYTLGRLMRDVIDDVNVEGINLHVETGSVHFNFDLRSDGAPDNDGFEHFLDDLDDVDAAYEESVEAIYDILIEHGFVSNPHDHINKFKHFKLDLNILESQPIFVGYLLGVNIHDVSFEKNTNSTAQWDYAHTKLSFVTHEELQHPGVIFPKYISPQNINWFIDNSLIDNSWPKKTPHGDENWLDNNIIRTPIKVYMTLEIPLSKKMVYEDFKKQIQFLDNNWNYFEKRAIHFWDAIARPRLTNTAGTNKFPALIKIPKPTAKQLTLPMESMDFKEFFAYGLMGV